MPVREREREILTFRCKLRTRFHVCFLVLLRYRTWCGEPVLPGWFVVVQSLQHDVHGERKQSGQEGVEN